MREIRYKGKNAHMQKNGEDNKIEKGFFYEFIGYQGLGRRMRKVSSNMQLLRNIVSPSRSKCNPEF